MWFYTYFYKNYYSYFVCSTSKKLLNKAAVFWEALILKYVCVCVCLTAVVFVTVVVTVQVSVTAFGCQDASTRPTLEVAGGALCCHGNAQIQQQE